MSDDSNPIVRDICRRNSDCFLNFAKPHIELLAKAAPGNCKWGDIDGTLEVRGYFLFLEWKSSGEGDLSLGQEIYHKQLTRLSPRITTIIAVGDPITMDPLRIRFVHQGEFGDWIKSSHEHLCRLIERWGEKALGGCAA